MRSVVPNLPVSPPPALRIVTAVILDDCAHVVMKRKPPICYMYDTERSRDAGSTVTTRLRGPKNGVHLNHS